MSSINKYCMGCGCLLQDKDKDNLGYVLNFEQDYCQRCFRLMHYGEKKDTKTNQDERVFEIIDENKNDTLFFFVCDAYESLILKQEKYLDRFKDIKLALIINKIDLLPKGLSEHKIESLFKKVLSDLKNAYPNICDALLTHKSDSSFIDMFNEYIDKSNYRKVCFVGRSNAGKSTLLNKLFGSDILITSKYIGSTLNNVNFEYNGVTYIDTPGLIDEDNILSNLNDKELAKLVKYKTIAPLGFQIYEPQSFFASGLFKIDVLPNDMVSIVFESNCDEIHRVKYVNAEAHYIKNKNNFAYNLYPWSNNEYISKGKKSFLIKGFGIIRIVGEAKVTISINDKIKIYDIGEYL